MVIGNEYRKNVTFYARIVISLTRISENKNEDRFALFAIFYKNPRLIAMPLKCAVNWEKSSVCSRVVPFSNQEQSLAQKLAQTMHVVYVETSTWHSISISAVLPRKLQLMNGNFQMDIAFSRTFALFMPISDRENRERRKYGGEFD